MNNDQEPQGEGSEEHLPGPQTPRDSGDGEERSASDSGSDASSEAAPRIEGDGESEPSDAGWRNVLSGLGVDTGDDAEWPDGRDANRSKPRSQPGQGAEGSREISEERPGSASPRTAPLQGQGRHEMEERAQWVGESEISIERLYELFDGAYMECDLDEDGDLRIVTDSGACIFLSLHEPHKLIRYMAFYKFRDEVVEYEKLLFVNALNDDIVFIRFSLNGADTLIADYYLPYSRGISPFHIVNAAKLMGRVITSGIRQHDTNNLLE